MIELLAITLALSSPIAGTSSKDFPTHRAEAKTKKIANRKCVAKAQKQAAAGKPYVVCIVDGVTAHSCQSGSAVGLPSNQGYCVGDYVIASVDGTKAALCSGNVWLEWTGKFMRRTIKTPFFCRKL
jgi:hypothetical protein